jgi:hypothetical protein
MMLLVRQSVIAIVQCVVVVVRETKCWRGHVTAMTEVRLQGTVPDDIIGYEGAAV